MPRYPETLAELFPQFAWYGDRLNPPLFAALALYDGKLYALGTRYLENARVLQQKFAALYAGRGLVALDPRDVREWQSLPIHGGTYQLLDAMGVEWQEVELPFSGFYESLHDYELDRALDSMFSDDSGCSVNATLHGRGFAGVDWGQVRLAYSQSYVDSFAAEFHLEPMRFADTESPRFYNFETDRIYAKVSAEEVAQMFRDTDPARLSEIATERHSSRSGFASFYSPDWQSWGPVTEWDHNQTKTLLLAYLATQGTEWESGRCHALCEDWEGNGLVSVWIYEAMNPDARRALRLSDYLRSRIERGEEAARDFFDTPT
jgi:hypothetical protein